MATVNDFLSLSGFGSVLCAVPHAICGGLWIFLAGNFGLDRPGAANSDKTQQKSNRCRELFGSMSRRPARHSQIALFPASSNPFRSPAGISAVIVSGRCQPASPARFHVKFPLRLPPLGIIYTCIRLGEKFRCGALNALH
jgi:hypothetical protein